MKGGTLRLFRYILPLGVGLMLWSSVTLLRTNGRDVITRWMVPEDDELDMYYDGRPGLLVHNEDGDSYNLDQLSQLKTSASYKAGPSDLTDLVSINHEEKESQLDTDHDFEYNDGVSGLVIEKQSVQNREENRKEKKEDLPEEQKVESSLDRDYYDGRPDLMGDKSPTNKQMEGLHASKKLSVRQKEKRNSKTFLPKQQNSDKQNLHSSTREPSIIKTVSGNIYSQRPPVIANTKLKETNSNDNDISHNGDSAGETNSMAEFGENEGKYDDLTDVGENDRPKQAKEDEEDEDMEKNDKDEVNREEEMNGDNVDIAEEDVLSDDDEDEDEDPDNSEVTEMVDTDGTVISGPTETEIPALQTSATGRTLNKTKDSGILPLNTSIPEDSKVILFWTRLYKNKDFRFGLGADAFKNNHCPETRCFASNNRGHIDKADAIVFHAWNMNMTELPDPKKRKSHQRYIFFSFEAPPTVEKRLNVSELNNFFNFTMTYRHDSDIFMPYGHNVPRTKPRKYKCPVKRKSEAVAWMVSNCDTHSKREAYVKELQKFIKVDVFGKCGTKRCGKKRLDKTCYARLNKDYKFYLSFENSLCRGYITEKLFRVLQLDVLPVVLGNADYSVYAPAKSLVNALAFPSPGALGKHLRMLNDNDDKYCKYFEWKRQYKIEILMTGSYGHILDKQAFCRLCQALHDKTLGPKVYTTFDKWWAGPNVCLGDVMQFIRKRRNRGKHKA